MTVYKRGSIGLFFRGDPTLKGWWTFDDTLTTDFSGNDYHLTDETANGGTAPTPTIGLLNNNSLGVYFNGINQCYKNASLTNYGRSLTIMAWIKPDSVPTSQKWILGQSGATQLVIKSNGKVAFYSYLGGVWYDIEDPNTVEINRPSFYAGTDDGTTFRLYKNGNLVASAGFSGSYNNNNGNTHIGGYYDAGNFYQMYQGKIDEAAIFFRALSPQEISQYHQWATSISKKDSLIGLIEEGTASTITALLSTLEAQKKDTVATLSDLQAEKKSPVAIQSTFEQEIKSTASLQSTLEKALKATASLYSLLEKYQVNTTALSSLLEKQGKSPVAFTSLLEKSQSVTTAIQTLLETLKKSNVALTSQLERQLKSTTALWTELETTLLGADTVALYSLLEKLTYATVSLQTTLEKCKGETVALSTFLQYERTSSAALQSTLEKALQITASFQSTLEKVLTATVSFQSTLEKAIENTVAMSSELEAKQFSATALLSVLEKRQQSVVALLTQLEYIRTTTTALNSTLEATKLNTVALYADLNYLRTVSVALKSWLEGVSKGTIALRTLFEKTTQSTIPLLSVLRPYKVIHPLHNFDKHSGLLDNFDRHTSKIHNIKKL